MLLLMLVLLVLCAKMQRGSHGSRESLRLRGRRRGTARGQRRDEGAVAVDHEAVVGVEGEAGRARRGEGEVFEHGDSSIIEYSVEYSNSILSRKECMSIYCARAKNQWQNERKEGKNRTLGRASLEPEKTILFMNFPTRFTKRNKDALLLIDSVAA